MHGEAEKIAMAAKLLSQKQVAEQTKQGRRIKTAPSDHHMGIF
jgi:hypothetical protein